MCHCIPGHLLTRSYQSNPQVRYKGKVNTEPPIKKHVSSFPYLVGHMPSICFLCLWVGDKRNSCAHPLMRRQAMAYHFLAPGIADAEHAVSATRLPPEITISKAKKEVC